MYSGIELDSDSDSSDDVILQPPKLFTKAAKRLRPKEKQKNENNWHFNGDLFAKTFAARLANSENEPSTSTNLPTSVASLLRDKYTVPEPKETAIRNDHQGRNRVSTKALCLKDFD